MFTTPTVTDEQLDAVHQQLEWVLNRRSVRPRMWRRPELQIHVELTEKTKQELSTQYRARPYWITRGNGASKRHAGAGRGGGQ